MTVAFQESPERVSTAMVRPLRSLGRVRVSPWKRAPQPPPFSLAGVHPGMGSGGAAMTGAAGSFASVGAGPNSRSRASSMRGAQPCADVEVPLGAEALEALTGLGRDADMKWYTVQHKDTQQHIDATTEATKLHGGTLIHRECETALDGLPARDHCGGSDPRREGEVVDFGVHHLPLPGGAPAPKKVGVALSTIPPSRAAPRRTVRGRARTGPAPHGALLRRGFGQSVPIHVQCGFPGTAWTTTARALPSDSADL